MTSLSSKIIKLMPLSSSCVAFETTANKTFNSSLDRAEKNTPTSPRCAPSSRGTAAPTRWSIRSPARVLLLPGALAWARSIWILCHRQRDELEQRQLQIAEPAGPFNAVANAACDSGATRPNSASSARTISPDFSDAPMTRSMRLLNDVAPAGTPRSRGPIDLQATLRVERVLHDIFNPRVQLLLGDQPGDREHRSCQLRCNRIRRRVDTGRRSRRRSIGRDESKSSGGTVSRRRSGDPFGPIVITTKTARLGR